MTKSTKPKRGRPPIDREWHPQRQLGRVPDAEWAIIKAAAEKSGKTFTAWALGVLLRAAKRVSDK